MLLLVGGLVVIVLVILVVVFLSVRSTRADAGDDYPARPTGRGRAAYAAADRGDASPRRPARRRSADDERLGDDDETGFDEPEVAEPEYSQPRSMPRPRGHQHDEDPGSGDRPVNRNDLRRKPGSRPRLSASARDRSGTDWPASDWGGVSDEQYWAELSADKPLATTARSAQPAIDPRQGAAAGDLTGRKGRRDAASGSPRQEAAPTMAAAPTTQFSLRSESESEAAASAEPWAAVSTARGSDTDPSIGGTSGWPDTAAGDSPAASWAAPGAAWAPDTSWTAPDTSARAPDAPDTSWAAPDTGARVPDAPGTEDTQTWAGEDPLTSPSFSAPRTYSDHVPDSAGYDSAGYGSAGYGSGGDYLASRAWPSDPGARPDGD